jgi:cytochrome P450
MQLKKDDILSRFLQVTENDPTYLRDIILNFVIAGKDTTATALSWFIYMLCKHPAVQNKIAQEVREATKVKEITNFAEFAASINDEALEKMNYLHAAITETLRLYPSVPVVRRNYVHLQFLAARNNTNKFVTIYEFFKTETTILEK